MASNIQKSLTEMSLPELSAHLNTITYRSGILSLMVVRECLVRCGHDDVGDSIGEILWNAAFELLSRLKRDEIRKEKAIKEYGNLT